MTCHHCNGHVSRLPDEYGVRWICVNCSRTTHETTRSVTAPSFSATALHQPRARRKH